MRRFPVILADLNTGALNLTTLKVLEPQLTDENHRELLEAARHRSRLQVEELVARLHPKPDARAGVRKLPRTPRSVERPATPAEAAPQTASAASPCEGSTPDASLPVPPNPPAPPRVTPLAPERYKIQFTADAETHGLIRRLQDLLRHRVPSGDLAQIFGLALRIAVEQVERRKLAATTKPRSSRGVGPESRTIPAQVKREVYARDGGQCAFVGDNGRRCTETGFVEFHHRVAYAEGGEATTENIELRCRAHNQYEALLDFGPMVREMTALWG